MLRRFALAIVLLALTTTAFAQTAIPTPDEFLGYKLGDRFTPWDRILDYFDELAKRSNLITVQRFGATYEGRPLVLATITSAKNRAALDEIRKSVVSLGDPSATTPARAADVAKSTPAIAWLAFGIHGNESSSAEAAMLVASTLLRDPNSAKLLDDLVILIDPLENPDGRERYVQWFLRMRGVEANPNPEASEHTEPWPGGRYNHYLIDMNRDWTWLSQRETQARIAEYQRWNPQVFVDFHEMSPRSTYFFPPDANPINVNLPKEVERWLETFGRANAEAFTQRGWPFFVAESYDLFYPGYGDSWPAMHGAVGMTYEMAGGGRAGSAYLRDDNTVLTLNDRLMRHYTTAITTLRTASANREGLLQFTYNSVKSQSDNGRNVFFILPGSPNFDTMISLLQRQGIQVGTLGAALTTRATRTEADAAESHTFPAGTAVVTTRQPLGGLAQTLLEKTPTFSKGFLEEQRQKAEADEADSFYDITSWSLPLAMNVETWSANAPVAADVKPYAKSSPSSFRKASYGYVVDAQDPNLYRFVGKMLANNVRFNVSEDAVTVGDRKLARGSVIVLKANNGDGLDATLERIAHESAIAVMPVESGWTGGTAFGSERIHYIRDPKIALVGGAGTSATSYGMLWHTLDVDTPIPHTTLQLETIRNVDLSRYLVLILPDGSGYSDRLGKRGIEKLQTWLRGGGTLIAVKDASAFLREKDVDISKLKPWTAPKKKDDDATVEERYNEFRIPGSAFRTTMNERSYLTFGVPRPPSVMIEGSAAFVALPHKIDNIVTIDAKNPLVSGVAWPESLDRLKGSPFLTAEPFGRGKVITFADEPNYRLFWRGTLPLFLNAVLYSPSFDRD
ncbi:MAG: hypothetical protein QOI24_404 [Acidobacteriota bacterium]|jgi:hypothetical protein|nr:hypothetical protein [Acidobacteriota bacterium]